MSTEELKKALTESALPEAQKKAFAELLPEMNDEEKSELSQILEDLQKVKAEYEVDQAERLAKLNAALDKHLKNTAREEGKYVRDEFEKLDKTEENATIQRMEEEINNL